MAFSHLHSLRPRTSLRKLRTAFASPTSPTPSNASATSSTSPLSTSTKRASSRFSGFNFDFDYERSMDAHFPLEGAEARRVIRQKKSMVEAEQEEERRGVAPELTALVEPRPCVGPSLGGIEEVLEGRV